MEISDARVLLELSQSLFAHTGIIMREIKVIAVR